MKTRYFTITCCALFSSLLFGQIPNPGFEEWENEVPVGWSSNNVAPLDFFPVSQSNTAFQGNFAVRGEVVVNPINQAPSPPVFQNATEALVAADPPSLSGHYVFEPAEDGTSMTIACSVLDEDDMPEGFGILIIEDQQSDYASFTVPIDYSAGQGNPGVKLVMSFAISEPNGEPALGSYFLIDELEIGAPNDIWEGAEALNGIGSPFPSLLTHSLTIPLSQDELQCQRVEIVDVKGQRVYDQSVSGPGEMLWQPSPELPNGSYIVLRHFPQGLLKDQVLLNR